MAKAARYQNVRGSGLQQVDLTTGKPISPAKKNKLSSVSMFSEVNNPGEDTIFQQHDTTTGEPKRISKGQFTDSAGEPTVVSNVKILEDLIPSLNARANAMPTFGADNNTDTASFGQEDTTADDIFGLGDGKKKKKKKTLEDLYQDDPYADAQMQLLKQMEQTSDMASREAIRAIRSDFEERRAQQEDLNASATNQIRQALLTAGGENGGSSRYAPLSSTGLLTAQESYGIKQLATLDKQERMAIAEARAAQQSNNYQLLQEKLNLVDSIREQKAGAMGEMRGSMDQAQRDGAVAELIAGGMTNPIELLRTLNAQGGDYTIEEITGSLSNLRDYMGGGGSFKFIDEKQYGPLLGTGLTFPDIQAMNADLASGASVDEILQGVPPEQQAAVRNALGITDVSGNIIPGYGAASTLDEQMIRTRLFPKMAAILNKGTLSDSDRKIIDERIDFFRNAGMSEQQILDTVSGWSADVSTPYNNGFRDVILANQSEGQDISSDLSRIGSLLSRRNYTAAMNATENVAMNKAKELAGETYFGSVPADTYTRRIDRIKQLMQKGGVVGFVEGNFNNLLGKIKGPQAAEIKAELKQLYQTFRKENAGVAVTPSEERYLNDLFADINDTKGNFITKLDVFQTGLLDRYNATRGVVSLPRVRVVDVLDPASKLQLYSADILIPQNGQIDL